MAKQVSPCKVLDNLSECLSAPAHCVPTVEYRLVNFELPIDDRQYQFFNLQEINLFVDDPLAEDQSDLVTSSNLQARGLSMNAPFVMMGICIYAYGEAHALALDGNWYQGQEALEALAVFPGSPTLLRSTATYLQRLGLPVDQVACQAQFDWGNPTWRAVWAFMHAYRIRVECPDTSTGEYLMDDTVADVGNCCSHALPEGFGDSKTNWIQYVRTVNDRLHEIQNGVGLPNVTNSDIPGVGSTADAGYFFPFNVEQGFSGADGSTSTVTPYRQPVDITAFGREYMNPTIEQWHRFACPIPLERESKIRIYFYKNNGSAPYLTRLLTELCMQRCIAPIATNTNPITLFEDDENPTTETQGYSTWTKIPGGRLRIGVGLKGFFVRPQVCADLVSLVKNGALPGEPGGLSCHACEE